MSSRITGPSIDIPKLSNITLGFSSKAFKLAGNIKYEAVSQKVNRLRQALQEGGISEFANILDNILREAISAQIWAERNGTSDIIDSGELLNSSRVNVTSNSRISIQYDVPYAALVHYGGYIRPYGNQNADLVYLPPRPWVQTVLESQFNSYSMVRIYSDIMRRLLANI
jgi:hypothetical protein